MVSVKRYRREVAEGVLTVKSMKDKDTGSTDEYTLQRYLAEKLTRKFTLADDIVVNGAELKDGMLTISLERIVPEEKKTSTNYYQVIDRNTEG